MESHADLRAAEGPGRKIRRVDCLVAALMFVGVVLQGLPTMHRIGISWDEPFYFQTAKGYVTWVGSLGRAGSFSAEQLDRTFGLQPLKNDHPTLTKIISAFTWIALKDRLGDFWAYRSSGPLLFALLLAALYLHLARSWGRVAALSAAFLLFTMPRFYTDSHIAATDAPLCLFWFLAVATFERACERRGSWPLTGLAYGLCMSVKFTGFLLPLPLLAWGLVYRRREMLRPALGLLLGPLVFLFLQPAMWHHPLTGIADFVRMSVTREQWNPHWVLFLGKIFNFSGPWYYAPFLTLVTVPEVTMLLSLLGAIRAFRDRLRDALAGSSLIHFSFFLLLTMSPGAPLFDGVRLFLPAFVFLAMLAGFGLDGVVKDLNEKALSWPGQLRHRSRAVGLALAGVLMLLAALPLVRAYPYGLEYYNRFVGGVRGARKAGLETTYWWTAVNEEHLARINQLLPFQSKLRFFPMDANLHELYQSLGLLRKDIIVTEGNDFDYVLILSRPFWNYARIFQLLALQQPRLIVVDSLVRDSVPFWVLYRR